VGGGYSLVPELGIEGEYQVREPAPYYSDAFAPEMASIVIANFSRKDGLPFTLSHDIKSRSLVKVTDVCEFTAEVVPFGQPSHDGGSFDPTSLGIVQCEHEFNCIADCELVTGWNNKSNPGSGNVSYQHAVQAFR
jgi:hypothetical protein